MPRHWLTIAVLTALIAGAVMLLNSPPQVFQPRDAQAEQRDARLTGYLTGVDSTQYALSGAVEYHFTAERMLHYQPYSQSPAQRGVEHSSPDDFTTIDAPFFTFFQTGNPPWYVRAQHGRSLQNGELVILRDDVRVWQDPAALEPTVITTSKLLIRPKTQVAETDQFVMITRPQMVTQGTGMRADLNQDTLAIFAEGKTIYEPTP